MAEHGASVGGTGGADEAPRRPRSDHELVRTTLAIVFILLLIGATFWILRPLLPAILWSSAIAVSTWPLLIGLQRRLGSGRKLAAASLTIMLVILLLAPLFFGIAVIISNASRLGELVDSLSRQEMPPPPGWLERLPFVGEQLGAFWREIAAGGGPGLLSRLAPYADQLFSWFVGQLGGVGRLLFHFIFTLIGVVFLYLHGDAIGARVCRFAYRLAGQQGDDVVRMAAQATRSVALGVLVTAIIQALLATLGMWVSGVPGVGLLTMAMIITGLAQLGPTPVLVPAVIWLFWSGQIGWGIALAVWTVFVGTIDNVLRPVLIRRGAALPMMLVFVGVVGGLMAFGVVGLFIGPVVLAVAYRLSEDWTARKDHEEAVAPRPVPTDSREREPVPASTGAVRLDRKGSGS